MSLSFHVSRIPHFNWSIYRGDNFFIYLFIFFEPGLKLSKKSIENGLEGQKFLVVCLFWGGCHHPNTMQAQKRSELRFEELLITDDVQIIWHCIPQFRADDRKLTLIIQRPVSHGGESACI